MSNYAVLMKLVQDTSGSHNRAASDCIIQDRFCSHLYNKVRHNVPGKPNPEEPIENDVHKKEGSR
jgi:hypothetical protein